MKNRKKKKKEKKKQKAKKNNQGKKVDQIGIRTSDVGWVREK